MSKRFRGSGFDMPPFGDLVDVAAVVADDALIDALAGPPPCAVPRAGDPVAELLTELLATWAADAQRDPPSWEAMSAPVIRDVPVVHPPQRFCDNVRTHRTTVRQDPPRG